MIERILIHNSPVFETLELNINNGLNVFSGASGAGKSVFMESLLAIFGIKDSNSDLIEVNISLKNLKNIKENLDEIGIACEDWDLTLSIAKKDKVRYFINHQTISKKRLHEILTGFMVHISNKNTDELKNENLLKLLDNIAILKTPEHKEILNTFTNNFIELKDKKRKLQIIQDEEKNIENLKDFAIFEIEKIKAINPQIGEYENLMEQKKKLSKLDKINNEIIKVKSALESFGVIDNFLTLVDRPNAAFQEMQFELDGIINEIENEMGYLEDIDVESMLNKISNLSELIKKYGGIQEALEHQKRQEEKLLEYENISFNKEKITKEIELLEKELEVAALNLSKNRTAALQIFEDKLKQVCEDLLLQNIKVQLSDKELDIYGKDICEILVNQSTISTLSTGEFNRIRLAVMSINSDFSDRVGVMILDEIDANLSGEESEGVAKILKKLSKTYQIFAISHQAHLCALANYHYLISKNSDNKSSLTLLNKTGRINEIARMISGVDISQEAIDFAISVLDKNGIK